MSRPTSNLDSFTVIRSDNRDVERVQLNKILDNIGNRLAMGAGEFDGGFANSVYTPGPGVIDGGAST